MTRQQMVNIVLRAQSMNEATSSGKAGSERRTVKMTRLTPSERFWRNRLKRGIYAAKSPFEDAPGD